MMILFKCCAKICHPQRLLRQLLPLFRPQFLRTRNILHPLRHLHLPVNPRPSLTLKPPQMTFYGPLSKQSKISWKSLLGILMALIDFEPRFMSSAVELITSNEQKMKIQLGLESKRITAKSDGGLSLYLNAVSSCSYPVFCLEVTFFLVRR